MTDLTETFWVAFVGTIVGFLGLSPLVAKWYEKVCEKVFE